ncbi:MAG TPA: DNA polymerase III subunit delta [Plasticicumulans sp.]|uniref:DNA polymerase III subunit delta n=1 Tax=Plasticicumulans sp. TaxID=2307179 RepID=UPI002CECE754|nr:DNA polymerase III subunit delta [Plasticicumulans sp.]HMW30706.1 DNA polymerase III subunit delta [Plasticicumulans sp.]
MRQRPEQLAATLARGLKPVYLIHGEEPLQALEAADAVRAAARAQGFSEREVLNADAGFDWNSLAAAAGTQSLFGERRLVELRIPSGKPGDAGARALRAWCSRPPEDTVLMVASGRLDAQQMKSAWFTALDEAGVSVQTFALETRAFPEWLTRRALARGLKLAPEAVALLATQTEGNLLAAAQELDKLWMLHGDALLDAEALLAAVADSARFGIYDLADAALDGDPARCARILGSLRAEGEEAVLTLWALAREIRTLLQAAQECARGSAPEAALTRLKVWDKRKPLMRRALARLDAARLQRLLADCARVDRTVKGQEAGEPWDALLALALGLAGCDAGLARSA